MPPSLHCQPRILLVGRDGQVGGELARWLAPLGTVWATSRRQGQPGGVPPVDLAEPESIRTAVREVRPDLIVNAAAYTAVDRAEAEPELAFAVNGRGPGVLAEEARRVGAAVWHYSTDYVFDGSGHEPWREGDRTGPLNVYGRSKLAGEEALRAAGVPHLILRVSWVYAPRGSNFVRTMLRLGADRNELAVVDDQCGAPTSARVIAEATAAALAQARGRPAEMLARRGGTYHLACAGETTWYGFAREIFKLARQLGHPLALETLRPIGTTEYPTPAARPKNSRLDSSRFTGEFRFLPPDWRTALARSFPPAPAADDAPRRAA